MNHHSRRAAFVAGLTAPWHGLQHMCRHPALWRYAIVPVVLNVLITAAVLTTLVAAGVALTLWLHPKFSGSWLGWIGEFATAIALLLAMVGGAAAAWMLLQGILCGYFYAKLAYQVELQLGMNPDEIKEVPFSYQVADAVRDFAALLAINIGFLFLHCIPVVGSIVGSCGALYFDCLIFGRDYLDYPLALRGKRRNDKWEFLRQHRMQGLGLGFAVLLLNFLPVLGAVVLTTAVTGAVLLHRTLECDDASSL
jgi:CysZ protein